jgi:hypothetical protein
MAVALNLECLQDKQFDDLVCGELGAHPIERAYSLSCRSQWILLEVQHAGNPLAFASQQG